MSHIALATQLSDPYAIAALCVNIALLVLPAAIALWNAERQVRGIALLVAVLAVGLRFVGWDWLPGGLTSDDYATLRQMSHQRFHWRSLFGENWDNGGNLYSNLPWYVAYRLSGSLLGIRFVGTLWSCSLAIVTCCFAGRLYGPFPALVCGVLATLTPWSLFLSRLPFGSDILVLQITLIWASWRLNHWLDRDITRSLVLITLVGFLTALSQYTYLGARVAAGIPVILVGFWGLRRLNALALITAVALAAWVPQLLTLPSTMLSGGSQLRTLSDPRLADPQYVLAKVGYVLWSFIDPRYSAAGTGAMQGAHAFGWFIACVVLSGAVFAPRFVMLAAIGMLPALLSTLPGGGSHRLMMMLVPLALIGGAGLHRLPVRPQKWTAIGVSALIIFISMQTWTSSAYWVPADHELMYGITIHQVAHREIQANANLTLRTDRIAHQMLLAQEIGRSVNEMTTVDCSRPFTLIFSGDADQVRSWADRFGGEIIPRTRDRLIALHLSAADARQPDLRQLDLCRPGTIETEKTSTERAGVAAKAIDRTAMRKFERDLVLWLEADTIAKVDDGDPLALWPDPRGVTRGAIQEVPASRPTFWKNARSGLPAVRFASAQRQTMVVRELPLSAHGTHFYVLRATGVERAFPFFEHGPDFNASSGSLLFGSNPMYSLNRDGRLNLARGPGPGWLGRDWVVVSVAYDDSQPAGHFQVRRNGWLQDNADTEGRALSDTTEVATLFIGSRNQRDYWSDMDLAEIILVNRALDPAEIRVVEDYLASKWAIALDR